MNENESKTLRILSLYERLHKGEIINKQKEAISYQVHEKTIQRDLEELRIYIQEQYGEAANLSYQHRNKGYALTRKEGIWLENKEILSVAKVLLESRAFPKAEMEYLLNKLILQSAPEEKKNIEEVILNERFHYAPVRHERSLTDLLWDFSESVRTKRAVEIHYKKERKETTTERTIHPVGILFSGYYFYVAAFIEGYDFSFPTIYRLDRILSYHMTTRHFKVRYKDRFEEGELRKRIQFMTPGELMKITFRFSGRSLEAVLDRFPTARVLSEEGDVTIVEAEVYGKGIVKWLLGQGADVEVLGPESLREEMKVTLEKMIDRYN